MKKVFCIRLSGLRFYSRIGVFPQERIVGNDFEVSLDIRFDSSGFKKEDLTTTISYADIYNEVKEIMNQEWLLLESICVTLSENIKRRWSFIEGGRIEIKKLSAPISGIEGSCGVEYYF